MLLWFGLLFGCPGNHFMDDLIFFDSGGFRGEDGECFGDVSEMEPAQGTAGNPSMPYIGADFFDSGRLTMTLESLEPVPGQMIRPAPGSSSGLDSVQFVPDAPLNGNTPYTATVDIGWCKASWTFMVGRYNEPLEDNSVFEQRAWVLPERARVSEMGPGVISAVGEEVPRLVQPVQGAQQSTLRLGFGDAMGQDLCKPTHDVVVAASNPWYELQEASAWTPTASGLNFRVEALHLGLRYDGSDAEMPEYKIVFDTTSIDGFCDEHFGCTECPADLDVPTTSCMTYHLAYGIATPLAGGLVARTAEQIAADPACAAPE